MLPVELMTAMGLLQEKWTLSILYVLMQGPNGFNGVGREAGAVNAGTLAQRLSRLEEAGLVEKTVQSTMPPRTSYALTAAGEALRPVIAALERWAARYAKGTVGGAAKARGTAPRQRRGLK